MRFVLLPFPRYAIQFPTILSSSFSFFVFRDLQQNVRTSLITTAHTVVSTGPSHRYHNEPCFKKHSAVHQPAGSGSISKQSVFLFLRRHMIFELICSRWTPTSRRHATTSRSKLVGSHTSGRGQCSREHWVHHLLWIPRWAELFWLF